MVIMYVGDNIEDIKNLRYTCEQNKVEIIITNNRGNAIELFIKRKIEIVIIDISNIDNPIAFSALESLVTTIKKFKDNVIIYTLATEKEQGFNAVKLQTNDIYLSPIKTEEINQIIIDYSIKYPRKRIFIQTMPDFQLYLDGKPIPLRRKNEKEILAFLVHRQGQYTTNISIVQEIWPEIPCYNKKEINDACNRVRVAICGLRKFLREYKISEILEEPTENKLEKEKNFLRFNSTRKHGRMTSMRRIKPETFECDLYELFDGNLKYIQRYNHKYMESYSWGETKKWEINDYLAKIGRYFPPSEDE